MIRMRSKYPQFYISLTFLYNILVQILLKLITQIMANNPLLGSIKMPALGYGTWQSKGEDLEKALEAALEAGYRHIDTAHVYENENIIGRVLQRWFNAGKLKREDLYVVTKLPAYGNRPESVQKYIKQSLEALQLSYVDMYLTHGPFTFKEVEGKAFTFKEDGTANLENTDIIAVWKEMEKLVDAGLTRAIGLSNFNIKQIKRILDNSRIKPTNLQLELHVYNQLPKLVDFCKQNGIVVTAYSSFGSPGSTGLSERTGGSVQLPNLLQDPVVVDIAKRHNKTPAQVLLRQLVQSGIATIPKSTNPQRVRENFAIFDFSLDDADIQKLKGLDKGEDGRIFDFSKFMKGLENHNEFPFRREDWEW